MAWKRIAWMMIIVGCARDNPFFDEGSTDGNDGSGPGSATSPSTTAASSTTQGPGTTSPDESSGDSLSNTDPVLTSEADTTSTGGSIGESTFATTGCVSIQVQPNLDRDAFVETDVKCDYCDDANYGVTNGYSVHLDGGGEAYYVMGFDGVPHGAQVVSARLITNIERTFNDNQNEVHVHAFWPGCMWQEGSGTGLPETPDGITYNHCDPSTTSGYPMGSLVASFGENLADPLVVDGKTGLVEIEFELHADAVQAWLDGGGDSLVLDTDAQRGAIIKPAREHLADGGVTLLIDVCK